MIKTLKAPVSAKTEANQTDSQNDKDKDSLKSKRTKISEIGKNARNKARPNTTNIKISAVDQNQVQHKEREEIHNFKLSNLDDFVEDSIIKEIRREKERQLKREEDEIKKNIILEKEKNEKNNELMKKMKENQNKHFTTDPLGNIILIKNPEASKLTAEFFQPKLNVLDKGNTQTNFFPSATKTKDSKNLLNTNG